MATSIISILIVILATIIGSFGAILLKKGSAKLSFNPFVLIKNKFLVGGYLLYGISTVIFILALRNSELSVIYPVVSMSYVWIALLSMKFLNEKMNMIKWLGVAAIIIGVSLIGIGA